ncbi:MAG: 50S ribosomal protein L9 [Phycisphaerae bacterium]
MKVLLTDTIDKIGVVGEVVNVRDGFARNYLLPRNLAVSPTEGNIKRYEAARKEYEAKLKLLREQKEKLVQALEGLEITIARASNEEGHLFGSVSRRDIAEELQKLGHAVQADDVRLDEPLRRVDTFQVAVQLAGDLKCQIKVWVVREKTTDTPTTPAAPEPATASTPAAVPAGADPAVADQPGEAPASA